MSVSGFNPESKVETGSQASQASLFESQVIVAGPEEKPAFMRRQSVSSSSTQATAEVSVSSSTSSILTSMPQFVVGQQQSAMLTAMAAASTSSSQQVPTHISFMIGARSVSTSAGAGVSQLQDSADSKFLPGLRR